MQLCFCCRQNKTQAESSSLGIPVAERKKEKAQSEGLMKGRVGAGHLELGCWMDVSVSRLTGFQKNLILEAEPSCTLGGIINWQSHREKRLEVPQKIKDRTTI